MFKTEGANMTKPGYDQLRNAMKVAHARGLSKTRFMPPGQVKTAWLFGHARFHGWAMHADCLESDPLARSGDCLVLARREEATSVPGMPGISPRIVSDGSYWHESCTGRTFWRVDSDGSARVWLFDNVNGSLAWSATVDVSPVGLAAVVASAFGDGYERVVESALFRDGFTVVPLPQPELRPLRDDAPIARL